MSYQRKLVSSRQKSWIFVLCAYLLSVLFSTQALANEQISQPVLCSLVRVHYEGIKGKNFEETMQLIDKQNEKIDEYIKQQGVKQSRIQGQSYNIYSDDSDAQSGMANGKQYQANGSINYSLDDFDVAMKFSQFLVSQNIQVSLSYSTVGKTDCFDFPDEYEHGC